MAHAQKPDFVFRRNGRVHLKRRGRQFNRLLAAEVCASAVVMLDTPCSEVVWEYWLPTPFASFPFTSPPCVTVCHQVSNAVYKYQPRGCQTSASQEHWWISTESIIIDTDRLQSILNCYGLLLLATNAGNHSITHSHTWVIHDNEKFMHIIYKQTYKIGLNIGLFFSYVIYEYFQNWTVDAMRDSPAQNSCSHIQELHPHFMGPTNSLRWSWQFVSELLNESVESIPNLHNLFTYDVV
jgi:hypothetical protein